MVNNTVTDAMIAGDNPQPIRNFVNRLGMEALRLLTAICHERLLEQNATEDQAARLATGDVIAVGCRYKALGQGWDAVAQKMASEDDVVVNPL